MQSRILKLAQIAAGAAILATAFTLPAAAEYHHRHWHRYHEAYDRPLTVTSHHHRQAMMAGPNPYYGPGAIITGPNAVAATIVSLPFRAAGAIFPPYGDPAANPLVIIGAPVHAAGYVAEFPFYVVGSAFGAPPNVYQ
jgi:hypothetical protein